MLILEIILFTGQIRFMIYVYKFLTQCFPAPQKLYRKRDQQSAGHRDPGQSKQLPVIAVSRKLIHQLCGHIEAEVR